ncbi:hypothetical protein U91I_00241 [alpha proteobacterium U9-1i]|nr:hypothetical protein U91I_00241 [alpha proteobacterium U9-1i]
MRFIESTGETASGALEKGVSSAPVAQPPPPTATGSPTEGS